MWQIFLGIALISTIQSPFPLRSLLGQEQMGDGLLYWLLIAIFSLSNNLLIKQHPELARSQLQGLVIGGIILALSIFPQVIDWRIDYTATTGKLIQDNILQSTIFQNQQPIGLYSHRGHTSFVIAAIAVITFVGWQWQWINTNFAIIASILIIPALILSQTRTGILALLVATIYLLGRKYYKLLIPVTLLCLLIITITTYSRYTNKLPPIQEMTLNRVYLWQMANYGIRQRPVFGWGSDGFGVAYAHIYCDVISGKLTRLDDFNFEYRDKKGQMQMVQLPTTKAHNLFLDTSLSVGLLGLAAYLGLLGWCFFQIIKSPYRGIEALVIAYLAFGFTWFECAQFTHLAWWTLSYGRTHIVSDETMNLSPTPLRHGEGHLNPSLPI